MKQGYNSQGDSPEQLSCSRIRQLGVAQKACQSACGHILHAGVLLYRRNSSTSLLLFTLISIILLRTKLVLLFAIFIIIIITFIVDRLFRVLLKAQPPFAKVRQKRERQYILKDG